MLDGYKSSSMKYEKPGLGDTVDEDDPHLQEDLRVTNSVAEAVEKFYPGHPWMIQVSHSQGIVKINIPLFMGSTNWFVIPINELKSDPGMRSVMRGCGEILERYNVPRSNFDRDTFLDARENIPIHLRGSHGYIPR